MISLASPISGALLKQAKDSESNTWEIEDIDPGVFRHLFGTCTLEIVLNWMLQRWRRSSFLWPWKMSSIAWWWLINTPPPKLLEAAIKCLVHSKDHICFYSLQLLQQIISHLNFHLKIFLWKNGLPADKLGTTPGFNRAFPLGSETTWSFITNKSHRMMSHSLKWRSHTYELLETL